QPFPAWKCLWHRARRNGQFGPASQPRWLPCAVRFSACSPLRIARIVLAAVAGELRDDPTRFQNFPLLGTAGKSHTGLRNLNGGSPHTCWGLPADHTRFKIFLFARERGRRRNDRAVYVRGREPRRSVSSSR